MQAQFWRLDSAVASSSYEGGKCVYTINSYCCNSLLDQGLPITKEVCLSVVRHIVSFVDFRVLLRQFKKHKIFGFAELSLTNKIEDVEIMLNALAEIRDGFQIFYQCLRETQSICSGHGEVANLLKRRGILHLMGLFIIYLLCFGQHWNLVPHLKTE